MVIQGLCFSKVRNSIHGLDTICKTNLFFPTVNKHLCGVDSLDIIILHISYILLLNVINLFCSLYFRTQGNICRNKGKVH